jgi:tetratricopeptide (TPR) repeat protein
MEGERGDKKGAGMGKRVKAGIAGSILLMVVGTLAMAAYARNSFWKDEIGLWEDCVRKAPQKERTHHNLGYAYYEVGQWEEAQGEFERALTLNPRYTLSMYNLGLVYYRKGMMEEAIDCNRKTLGLNSPPPETYYNLGLAYSERGLYPEAIESFKTLLKIKPDYEKAHCYLEIAKQRLERKNREGTR